MEEQTQINSRFNFGKVFEYCFIALLFLVPIFFVPSLTVSLYSSKILIITTLMVVFFAVFLASTLSSGLIVFPKSKFLIPIALFPVIAIISSLFSGEVMKSVSGQVFDLGGSGSFFILTMLLFMAVFSVRDDIKVGSKSIYWFLLSSGVIILHLLARIFSVSVIPQAIASRIPNFLLGGATDTSIILGAICVAAISCINIESLGNRAKYALYLLIVISMLFIGAIGFMPVIVVLGLFSLIYFVYTFSWSVGSLGEYQNPNNSNSNSNKASFPSLLLLAISVIFVLSGDGLGGYLSNTLKINSAEVRPSFETSLNLIGESWKKNPVLGVGPNMFKELWDLKKPLDVNATQFWAADFNFSSSFFTTIASTTGLLGSLSLIVFLIMFVSSGFKAIFSNTSDNLSRYVSSTSFFVALFLWIMTFVYVPSISVMALTFIFTGIFAGTLVSQNNIQNVRVNVFKNPRANFISVFVIISFLIASIAFGYFVWERVVAASIFQKYGASRSLRIVPTDLYWRGFSDESLSKISNIIGSVSSVESLNESQKVEIQNSISDSIEGARQAIDWNSKNYQNWFALGRVYEVLATNGIAGAVENSKSAFAEAQIRAPGNPAIHLSLARLSVLSNDLESARSNIAKSIELKPNYTDAYFALAQIEVATNNISGAINSVESATFIDPQNTVLYFQLGLLKYNNKDYIGAAKAFERSVEIVPDYANARYFLGLSYEKLNKINEAIDQFEIIEKTNPDNAEIGLILKNLRAGRDPFTNAKPPVDDKPEKRSEPPIEE